MLEQSNAAGTSGSHRGWVLTLYFCCGCTTFADDGLLLRPSGLAAKSASEMPVIPTHSPNKTRRLKNPPSLKLRRTGADVFFMRVSGYEVDGGWMGGIASRRRARIALNALFYFFPGVYVQP